MNTLPTEMPGPGLAWLRFSDPQWGEGQQELGGHGSWGAAGAGGHGSWGQGRASLCLLLPALDPLLQQVLIVAVGPGAQREHTQVGEEAAVGVDEHGH